MQNDRQNPTVPYDEAVAKLRAVNAQVSHDSDDEFYRTGARIRDAKKQVLSKYTPMFSATSLDKLTGEDFRGFLLFRNNQHWDSLHRQGGRMTADMAKLREALKLLGDESIPIRTRLDTLRPPYDEPMVQGLGQAVITAILQILYPDRYGVLNNRAEESMRRLSLWPDVPRTASLAKTYEKVNAVLLRVAGDLGIDLWTLDMLWWRLDPHTPRGSESD